MAINIVIRISIFLIKKICYKDLRIYWKQNETKFWLSPGYQRMHRLSIDVAWCKCPLTKKDKWTHSLMNIGEICWSTRLSKRNSFQCLEQINMEATVSSAAAQIKKKKRLKRRMKKWLNKRKKKNCNNRLKAVKDINRENESVEKTLKWM